MRIPVVLFIAPLCAACAPSPVGPAPAPNPDNGVDVVAQCFELQLKGSVASDARLPRLIELTRQACAKLRRTRTVQGARAG
jgi:hypothetical protein